MPKKNGHEVLEVIKDNPKLEEIPVVVLTVSEAEEDIARALGLKMNFYLNKPVNVKKLAPILTTIIDLWN
jgi:CheY-like chemotaxis protein